MLHFIESHGHAWLLASGIISAACKSHRSHISFRTVLSLHSAILRQWWFFFQIHWLYTRTDIVTGIQKRRHLCLLVSINFLLTFSWPLSPLVISLMISFIEVISWSLKGQGWSTDLDMNITSEWMCTHLLPVLKKSHVLFCCKQVLTLRREFFPSTLLTVCNDFRD